MIKRYIQVKTSAEFIHQYSDAPLDVHFLHYPHRHMLQIEVSIEVFSDDRELEFILVKRALNKFLDGLNLTTVSNRSCEMIGQEILTFLKKMYGCDRSYQVLVSEDGENGSIISYIKKEEV